MARQRRSSSTVRDIFSSILRNVNPRRGMSPSRNSSSRRHASLDGSSKTYRKVSAEEGNSYR